jgi:preprotein translocase subunit SecA
MMFDTCENIIVDAQDHGDYETFQFDLIRIFGVEPPFNQQKFLDGKTEN